MFDSWKRRIAGRYESQGRRGGVRPPVTIGFEQLEVREMMSAGVAMTIIPTDLRPLLSMPKPHVGTFDPESSRAITVSMGPRTGPDAPGPATRPWRSGGRFRMRMG